MRWEDQELNHATGENKFPEVLYAAISLRFYGWKRRGRFVRVDQKILDEMIAVGPGVMMLGGCFDTKLAGEI